MGTTAFMLCAALLAAEPGAAGFRPSTAGPEPGEAEIAEEPRGGAGVSPVELIPRIELRETFLRTPGGISSRGTTVELDLQFVNRVLLRYQAPIRIVSTPAGQVSGFGDLQLEAIAILASDALYVVGALLGGVLDTASQPPLGAGKDQIFFGGAAAYKPRPWWLPYIVAQEQLSIGGNSSRPDVNQLLVRIGNIFFGRQFNWLKLDLDTTVDFPGGAAGRFFGTLELGSLLIGRVGMFVRSGTQLLGERELDYSLEAGFRYLFRLERGK
jgi:hypothetical protein